MSDSQGGSDPGPGPEPDAPTPPTAPPGFAGRGPDRPAPEVASAPAAVPAPTGPTTASRSKAPLVIVVVALLALATGGTWFATRDGDDDAPAVTTTSSATTTTAAPSPDARPADNINGASAAACQLNLQTTQTAIDAYTAVSGSPPPSLEDLVPDYLDEVPTGLQLTDGAAAYAPGGGCA